LSDTYGDQDDDKSSENNRDNESLGVLFLIKLNDFRILFSHYHSSLGSILVNRFFLNLNSSILINSRLFSDDCCTVKGVLLGHIVCRILGILDGGRSEGGDLRGLTDITDDTIVNQFLVINLLALLHVIRVVRWVGVILIVNIIVFILLDYYDWLIGPCYHRVFPGIVTFPRINFDDVNFVHGTCKLPIRVDDQG
jgi:hypothetical protein